jgi:hypothetical protein
MRRNVGRAMKGGTIKTRALKPAYNAPGAAARAKANIVAGQVKRKGTALQQMGNKAKAGDVARAQGARAKANIVAGQAKRKGNIAARQQAVATGAQQQATAAAGRQRALAGPGATGLGKMPAVGGPQGSAGYRAGQAAGGALRGVGQAMAGARRAGAGIAAAPGRAMSKLRTGVSSGVSNISRGFRAGATKTAILRPGLSAARRLTAAGMKSKEPIKGAVGTMTSAGKSLKKAIVQGDRHPAVGGALSRMHAQKAQKTLSKGNLDRRLQRVAHRPGAKAHSAISKAEGVSETANRYAG